MRLDDTIEGFWLARRRTLSKYTIRDYDLCYRRLKTFLGDPEFEKIKASDLNRFMDNLNDLGLSQKTQLNNWTALSALWSWAERTLDVPHIMRNGKVDKPKPKRRQSEPYDLNEVRAMLDACETCKVWQSKYGRYVRGKRPTAVRDRAMILVFLDCGLRVQELCDLKVEDYDKRHGQLTIHHGKGDKKRVVYLGDNARQALWKYLNARPKADSKDPLFANRDENTHLTRTNVLHLIVRIGVNAGVKDAHPHRFRHTFAINYLRNGGNILALQQVLGHEKLDTVRIYAKIASVDLEQGQRQASPVDNWNLT